MRRAKFPQIKDLIHDLGGGKTVAAELSAMLPKGSKKIDPEAVYKWVEFNSVPRYRRTYMALLARKRDKTLPAELRDHMQSLEAEAAMAREHGAAAE